MWAAVLWLVPQLGVGAQAQARLELLPDEHPQAVFSGHSRLLSLRWRNPGEQPFAAEIRSRIYQTSSSTVAPVGESPWKRLTVLPDQTVIESAVLSFPAVWTETRFLVQWVAQTNRVLGGTEVLVYPTDLLAQLKPLLRNSALGVFDPMNQLKPWLNRVAIETADLQELGLDHFEGSLAILGPFESRSQMRGGFRDSVKALATKGANVVWIQPPPEKRHPLKPSFYAVREGKGNVVVAQAELLEGLGLRPESQLALLELCRLAVNPSPLQLPGDDPEP